MEQIKKIKDLTNEELKLFFSKFDFSDYDFCKQNNTIELRVYNEKRDLNFEYVITDNKVYGDNKDFAHNIEKKFKAFCSNSHTIKEEMER